MWQNDRINTIQHEWIVQNVRLTKNFHDFLKNRFYLNEIARTLLIRIKMFLFGVVVFAIYVVTFFCSKIFTICVFLQVKACFVLLYQQFFYDICA